MADDRLRHLERGARQGGPEAQARALNARLRAGSLTREHLELAAFLGNTVAARAAGVRTGPREIEAFCAGLARFGQGVCVRAAWIAASEVPAKPRTAVEVLLRMGEWLADPSEKRRLRAVSRLNRSMREEPRDAEDESTWWETAARLLLLKKPEDIEPSSDHDGFTGWALFLQIALRDAALFVCGFPNLSSDETGLDGDACDAAELELVDRLREHLGAWALGVSP